MYSLQPREGDACVCGEGFLVEKDAWHVCCACGGAVTRTGKYLPPHSGWEIPKLTLDEINAASEALDREDTARTFMRAAFADGGL